MRRWRLLSSALCCVVAISLTAASLASPSRGTVRGGILACDALGYHQAEYVAGTVTVLQGQVMRVFNRSTGSLEDVIPTKVVAQEIVRSGGRFAFELDPGWYVLVASTPGSYTAVNINPGDEPVVDLPNGCI